MNLKKYFTLTRAGVIEALEFRLSFFVKFVGNILYLIVVYFLWKAIYDSAGTDTVNGMTFIDTLIYLVLATALFNFMGTYTVWDIGQNIQSGKIILYLLRPMEYRKYLFWASTGWQVTQFFLTFLPTFIVVTLVAKASIHIGLNLVYFAFSILMAISINYSIDFFVGTICLYTESIWGINIMKQVIVLLFSGATIPIAFFPEILKKVMFFLPFQSIYNAPLLILLDKNSTPKMLFLTLGTQFLWCILMMVLSKFFWNLSVRRITVNGG